MSKMDDDRYDVTPEKHCNNCSHLLTNDVAQADLCLRDNNEIATYRYHWEEPDEMFDLIRKSCLQWKGK